MKFFLSINSGFELAKSNIKKQIRENIFGYFWVFFVPFIYAFCFLIVKQSINVGHDINIEQQNISVFRAFVGMSFLQLWIQLLQDTSQLIKKRKNFLRSLSVSLEPFVYCIFFEALISLFVRMLLVYFAAIYFKFEPSLDIGKNLILFGCAFLIMSSAFLLGMLILPWSSLFGDFKRLIASLAMPIALLSPIFYEPVVNPASPLYWFNMINPIAISSSILCDVLFHHEYIYIQSFIVWSLLPILFFFPLLKLLNKQLPIILERLG
jgi:ABC-type polysaccharide/polyol phosphate export permease